jgi:hypothetical protein
LEGVVVIGRLYFARQAKTLLAYAKSTQDPNLAAVLVEKAADLTSRFDEAQPPRDIQARAPDVETAAKDAAATL